MPRAQVDLGGGRIVKHGEMHAFEEYLELQRAVVPVVALRDGVLTGVGTAVCIGAGWFLTAAHVVRDLVGDDWDVRVILETDTPVSADPLDVFGGAFQVRGIHTHPDSDLATLSVALPSAAHTEIRSLKLRLRLPELGEPVVTIGYPHMARDQVVDLAATPSVAWERTLSAGVGIVLVHQLERSCAPWRRRNRAAWPGRCRARTRCPASRPGAPARAARSTTAGVPRLRDRRTYASRYFRWTRPRQFHGGGRVRFELHRPE